MARRRRASAVGRLASIGLTLGGFTVLAFLIARLESANSQKIAGNPYVVDGDSLVLNEKKLRLLGIDAPEMGQECRADGDVWPCGAQARTQLRRKIDGQIVSCTTWGEDRYQRLLATCSTQQVELNAWLVRSGWAVDYGGYAREEGEARRARSGIWRGDFENPGEWRRLNRSQASAMPHSMPSWLEKLWVWLRFGSDIGGKVQ